MRVRTVTTSLCVVAGLFVCAEPGAAQCRPDGDVEFVCGPVSPEDLLAVPDSPWVIAAGMEDDGYLYAVDTRDLTNTVLFPTATFGSRYRMLPQPTHTSRFRSPIFNCLDSSRWAHAGQ